METRGVLRRVRKIGNAHIFEPTIARDFARHRLLDEILSFFGGKAQPMMAQLAESGHLTMDDVRALEATIRRVEQQKRAERKKR
jgi:predicted transcriptional regulator